MGARPATTKAAIPALAARLSIWARDDLFDPRPPVHVVVRHLAARALRAAYRVTLRPLVTRVTRSH